MRGLLEDENLSLRHLPELSPTPEASSFQLPSYAPRSIEDSFQIPSGSGLDLLNDTNDDFLADMAPTPAVRAITRISHPPLTLEELTPRRAARRQVSPERQSPSKGGVRTPTARRRIDLMKEDPPMTPASFEELKSKFDLFLENKPMTTLIEEALQTDHTAQTPSRDRVMRGSESPPKFSPKRTPRQLTIEHLSPSKTINKSPTRNAFPRSSDVTMSKGKQKEAVQTPQKMPMSPMRPASKRVASAASSVEPIAKRKPSVQVSKPTVVVAKPRSKPISTEPASKEPTQRAVTRVERPKRTAAAEVKKATVPSNPKPVIKTNSVVTKKTTVVTKPKSGISTWLTKGPAVRKEPSSSSAASSSGSRKISQASEEAGPSTIATANHRLLPEMETDAADMSAHPSGHDDMHVHPARESDTQDLDQPAPELPVAGPSRAAPRVFGSTTTKPEPFNFSVPSRSTSRASNSTSQLRSSRSTSTRVNPVPDYKALHASHNALMASRRQQVQPTVPLPLELSTQSRAKERARFEELLKEKELEQQMAEEEERRKKEAEELAEVKELRKRAVVKAHEVPDWYKDAPKRKKKRVADE